jgi:hypothetical protein
VFDYTSPGSVPPILDGLIAAGEQERAVELAIDLGHILAQCTRAGLSMSRTMTLEPEEDEANAARSLLPENYAAIAYAARVLRSNAAEIVPLPPPAAALLAATPGCAPAFGGCGLTTCGARRRRRAGHRDNAC